MIDFIGLIMSRNVNEIGKRAHVFSIQWYTSFPTGCYVSVISIVTLETEILQMKFHLF